MKPPITLAEFHGEKRRWTWFETFVVLAFIVACIVSIAGCGEVSTTASDPGQAGAAGTQQASAGASGGVSGSQSGLAGQGGLGGEPIASGGASGAVAGSAGSVAGSGSAGSTAETGQVTLSVWPALLASPQEKGTPGPLHVCVYTNDMYGAFEGEDQSQCAAQYKIPLVGHIPDDLIVQQSVSSTSFDFSNSNYTQASPYSVTLTLPVSSAGDYLVVIYQNGWDCNRGNGAMYVPWNNSVMAGFRVGIPTAGYTTTQAKSLAYWIDMKPQYLLNDDEPGTVWAHWNSCSK